MPGRADDIPARAVDARALSAAPADKLTERLERLPPGHPSSPYDADGTRREPDSRLPDRGDAGQPDDPFTADETRRLTDAEWKDHLTEAREILTECHAAGRETQLEHTVDRRHEIWSDDRAAVHETIIEDILGKSSEVPREYKAIIAGGLGGAGKSTVLEQYAGIDRSEYLTINPDDIKEELADRGLLPEIPGLTPMEASDLAHEETSYIAKLLASRARGEGINIIWDITMSSRESTNSRINELRESGYEHVEGLFVDIPVATSVTRAEARHRAGHEMYRAGHGLGGRLVPAEVIEAQADSELGSKNRRTFEGIKDRFDSWSRYDNSVDGRAPVLVEASWTREIEHEERAE
jgi:predicted kinase